MANVDSRDAAASQGERMPSMTTTAPPRVGATMPPSLKNSVVDLISTTSSKSKSKTETPPRMFFADMKQTKCAEMFNAAVEKLKLGKLEDAILLLQEAEFFSPEDPTPLVAHAECFVYLCDLQSAIRYYRRALWAVQKRDNLDPTKQKPSTLIPTKNGLSSAIPPQNSFVTATQDRLTQYGSAATMPPQDVCSATVNETAEPENEANPPAAQDGGDIDETEKGDVTARRYSQTTSDSEMLYSPNGASSKLESSAVQGSPLLNGPAEVTRKNAGPTAYGEMSSPKRPKRHTGNVPTLSPQFIPALEGSTGLASPIGGDAVKLLSPAVFHESSDMQDSMSMWQTSRTQRIRKNANEVQLADIQMRLAGLLDAVSLTLFSMKDFPQALQHAEDSLALVDDPVVQLHRCVYLISLQREEEAESLLEVHMKKYEECRVQTSALMIQLLVNRQAFRPARMLLDNYTGTTRYEDCLTVAKHIFHSKYERYRQKALDKKDLGTISKCIDVFPNDVELLFARAKIRIDAGEHRKSVKDLFRCVKETNGTHKEAIETMTSVLFTIGTSLDGEEGIQEAIVYYSESLKWRSDNTLVLLARADCYVKLEEFEDALTDYRRILQINPDDPTASRRIAFLHDLWGRKLYSQGKVKDAEIEFTNAIKECDTEALFYYHRGLCRFNLDEARYGLRDVLSCQQLKPTDPTIKAFIVRYLGTTDVPDTTKAFKQAEMKHLVVQDQQTGETHLTNLNAPPISFTTKKAAKKFYGRPSARITKVLLEAQQASEAVGKGAVPIEKVFQSVHGATSKEHTGFVDFVCSNAPEGALTLVTGRKTVIEQRKAPIKYQAPPPRSSKRPPSTPKLPALANPRAGTARPNMSGLPSHQSSTPSFRPGDLSSEVQLSSASSVASRNNRS